LQLRTIGHAATIMRSAPLQAVSKQFIGQFPSRCVLYSISRNTECEVEEPVSPKRSYRSFLLRCWTTEERDWSASLDERFVVESVSGAPHRWGFTTFEDLVNFLRTELLGPPEDAGRDQRGPSDE
jgi:hypothetical protein